MSVKLTNRQFIAKCRTAHGSRYDYSQTVYISAHKPITVICSKHGPFRQRAVLHRAGAGCQRCARVVPPDTKEFIERSKKLHGDLYDYSKAVYVRRPYKVEIICKRHGSFWQTAIRHSLTGTGCPQCARKNRAYSSHGFIQQARKIHGDRYTYPEEYRGSSHLQGTGCPGCAHPSRRISLVEFLQRAQKVHGDRYDYTEVSYHGTHRHIVIICRKHGPFNQTPHSHLNQQAHCPKCRCSKGEFQVQQFLEHAGIAFQQQVSFDSCRSPTTNRRLRFDFYLPAKKVLIEYDGEQHFTGWGKRSPALLEEGRVRDRTKDAWATANDYHLIRISYLQFGEIEQILHKELPAGNIRELA